ncbi:MAG: stage III sporulation protein AF [Lachnospiraceae bacterium]|nr:stage III sporulation protein AF [Lachnospiraceae bacterium]
MNEFVKLIGKIGIFMIAGQAVIHFAPEQKYAKYMKLIVGLVILIQFLSPIYKLIGGSDEEWNARLSGMAEELNAGLFTGDMASGDSYGELINGQGLGSNSLNAGLISGMEKEIKSKLNNEISGEGYSVIKVSVDVSISDKSDISTKSYYNSYANNDNSSYEKYKLSMIRVAVRVLEGYENTNGAYGYSDNWSDNELDDNNSDGSNIVRVEKVSIQKITTDKEEEQSYESAHESDHKEYPDKQKMSDTLKERFCTVLGIEEEYMEVSIYGTVE